MIAGLRALVAMLAAPVLASAQAPAKPMTEGDLLRQIESLSPAATDPGRRTPATMPVPGSNRKLPGTDGRSATASVGTTAPPLAAGPRDEKGDKTEKKEKGPTEIVALEATFDQKAHVAVFINQVFVTDPEFNVQCDKLTAYLKHDEKPAGDAPVPVKAATPAPDPKSDDKKQQKGGGLDTAIAEADPGKIVTVTQEKKEADGSITHSIGHGKKAHYESANGDITLTGHPDVQQGVNTCVSTEEETIMILNRDGHMRVIGPHKTVIADQSGVTK